MIPNNINDKDVLMRHLKFLDFKNFQDNEGIEVYTIDVDDRNTLEIHFLESENTLIMFFIICHKVVGFIDTYPKIINYLNENLKHKFRKNIVEKLLNDTN